MSRKPTLFYSKKCQHCAEVLNKIRLAGGSFGSNFDYVLIDGNRNLPAFLKEVPTLLAPGYQQPMTGEAVFMWIDTQLRRNASMNQPQATAQRMMPSGGQPQPTDLCPNTSRTFLSSASTDLHLLLHCADANTSLCMDQHGIGEPEPHELVHPAKDR